MSNDNERSEAAQSYEDAYASHYSDHDYPAALRSYGQVITQHPGAPEAEYSRSQILNIVKRVVPAKELLAAQLKLVLQHLQPDAVSPATVSP